MRWLLPKTQPVVMMASLSVDYNKKENVRFHHRSTLINHESPDSIVLGRRRSGGHHNTMITVNYWRSLKRNESCPIKSECFETFSFSSYFVSPKLLLLMVMAVAAINNDCALPENRLLRSSAAAGEGRLECFLAFVWSSYSVSNLLEWGIDGKRFKWKITVSKRVWSNLIHICFGLCFYHI